LGENDLQLYNEQVRLHEELISSFAVDVDFCSLDEEAVLLGGTGNSQSKMHSSEDSDSDEERPDVTGHADNR